MVAERMKSDPSRDLENGSTIEYPEGIEFEILNLLATISKNNITTFEKISDKLKFNKARILKIKTDKVRQERMDRAKELIDTRRTAVQAQIQTFFGIYDLEKIKRQLKKRVAEQKKLAMYFDDRMSITSFQKVMAKFAVDLGYDQNEIAKFLQISSKHMKNNIYSEEAKQENLLLLRFFDRCPDCGIELSEFFESKIDQFKAGIPINYEDSEIELLKPTGYQKEIIELKKEVSNQKSYIQRLSSMAGVGF